MKCLSNLLEGYKLGLNFDKLCLSFGGVGGLVGHIIIKTLRKKKTKDYGTNHNVALNAGDQCCKKIRWYQVGKCGSISALFLNSSRKKAQVFIWSIILDYVD